MSELYNRNPNKIKNLIKFKIQKNISKLNPTQLKVIHIIDWN